MLVSLGRLIPTESARYQRSPGMVFWRAGDAAAARALAEHADAFIARGMEPALAIEATLRMLAGAAVVPDYGPVAASPQEATNRLALFWQALRAAGVGTVMARETVDTVEPERGEEPEGIEARFVGMDPPLIMWVQALQELARAGA